MKVAVTSQGKNLEDLVNPSFGRAPYFILVDSENHSDLQVIENVQNVNAPQGAGIQAGKTIVNSGVKVLITRHCGPKAFNVLKSNGIKVAIIQVDEDITVRNAVEHFKNDSPVYLEEPNVEGHWA